MASDPLTFSGPEVEPVNSPSWQSRTPRQAHAYYDRLGWLLRDELDSMLAAGRGLDGRYLVRRKHPRSDRASGPPLTPHRAASRARRLLVHYPSPRGVRISWRASGRRSWRMVMEAHAEGAGSLPVRNIVGLAQSRIDRAVSRVRREWLDLHPWERRGPMTPAAATASPFLPFLGRPRPILPPLPAARP